MISGRIVAGMVAILVVAHCAFQASTSAAPVKKQVPLKGNQKQLHWHTDLKAAYKSSVRTGKPIMLTFSAPWCGYCRKQERETLATPALVDYIHKRFVICKLDYEKNRKVAEVLEIESLPTTVILSSDVDLIAKRVGYMTPLEFQRELAKALELNAELALTKE